MFTIPITSSGDPSLTGSSSNTIAYTDSINLNRKIYDSKNLALKVDIGIYDATTSVSSDSGTLFVYPMIAESPAGTYVAFINGNSGTTLVITGGTSATGTMGNGSYFIPLSIVMGSGITEPLSNVPNIKFGHRASPATRPWEAYLCVG